MKCFYLSRDFSLLFQNYNTDFTGVASVFASFVDKKYITAHQYMLELANLVAAANYEAFGRKLDKFLQMSLGSRVIGEEEWEQLVKQL